jgi:hypothetical protein
MAMKLDLWDVIDADAVADYLCADHGDYFGVYPDGSYSVGPDVGAEIDPDERPLFRVRCPGIGNVDRTWWAAGVDGAEDMDTEDLVRQGCAGGDVSGEVEDLVRRLEEARAEAEGVTECAYCGVMVDDGNVVPPVDDGESWDRLAAEHGDGCEWVETRAHRLLPASEEDDG